MRTQRRTWRKASAFPPKGCSASPPRPDGQLRLHGAASLQVRGAKQNRTCVVWPVPILNVRRFLEIIALAQNSGALFFAGRAPFHDSVPQHRNTNFSMIGFLWRIRPCSDCLLGKVSGTQRADYRKGQTVKSRLHSSDYRNCSQYFALVALIEGQNCSFIIA